MRVYNSGLEGGRFQNAGDIWLDHLPSELGLCFYNASLEADEVFAYIILSWRINQQALTLKYASTRQKENPNTKYAFRCWLLRLGFIGKEYKAERTALLKNLEGSSAFKAAKGADAE